MAITPEHFAAEQGPTLLRTAQKKPGGMMPPGTVCFRSFPVQMLISPRG